MRRHPVYRRNAESETDFYFQPKCLPSNFFLFCVCVCVCVCVGLAMKSFQNMMTLAVKVTKSCSHHRHTSRPFYDSALSSSRIFMQLIIMMNALRY